MGIRIIPALYGILMRVNVLWQQPAETPAPAVVVGERIKGMVRVGDLAKGLLLKESREVDVVLMCLKAPTKTLLENVVTLLKEKLKEIAPDKLYQVKPTSIIIK